MERGFLSSSIKDKSKEDGGKEQPPLVGLAKQVKNIKGKVLERDGKPLKSTLKRSKVVADNVTVGVQPPDGTSNTSAPKEVTPLTTMEGVHDSISIVNLVRDDAINMPGDETTNKDVNKGDLAVPNATDDVTNRAPKTASVSFVSIINSQQAKTINFRLLLNDEKSYVNNTWGKFGLQKLMKNDNGVYLFKFSSSAGIEQVLERGPWMIRKSHIILTKLSPYLSIRKGEEVVMATLNEEDEGYTREVIRVEYKWKPPHCVDCKFFGHDYTTCLKRVREAALKDPTRAPKSTFVEENEDGFVQVKSRKTKKKTGQGCGINLSKCNPNFQYRSVSQLGKGKCEGSKENNGPKKGSVNDNDNVNSDFVSLKNSFANLMDEDSALDEGQNVSSFMNADGNNKGTKDCTKVVHEEVKSQAHDSLWEKFKESKEASTSKSKFTRLDCVDDSDDDEGFPSTPKDGIHKSLFFPEVGDEMENEFSLHTDEVSQPPPSTKQAIPTKEQPHHTKSSHPKSQQESSKPIKKKGKKPQECWSP
nr:hypothetical protein [Tanacetum cinerariifolium]